MAIQRKQRIHIAGQKNSVSGDRNRSVNKKCLYGKLNISIVEKIINIGRTTNIDSDISYFKHVDKYDFINRLHWKTWNAFTVKLDEQKLIFLIKGLTLCETKLNWCGGSVSSVIWTFNELRRRNSQYTDEVADWILGITNNPYVPFGTKVVTARSLKEYKGLLEIHKKAIYEGIQFENRMRELHNYRISIKQETAKHRNTQARKNFLLDLSKLTVEQQINKLLNDTIYAVEFYPTCLAYKIAKEGLINLTEANRMKLLEKLKGKHKGPWQKAKTKLLELIKRDNNEWEIPWNMEPWFNRRYETNCDGNYSIRHW